jgi:LPXTG-motif cell wall-anchored protein
VCAKGEGNFLRCAHASSSSGLPWSGVLIAGLLALVVKRRAEDRYGGAQACAMPRP